MGGNIPTAVLTAMPSSVSKTRKSDHLALAVRSAGHHYSTRERKAPRGWLRGSVYLAGGLRARLPLLVRLGAHHLVVAKSATRPEGKVGGILRLGYAWGKV